jgi:MFS family permease
MSILVPRRQLARMNGLRSLSWDTTNVLAPVLGGLLLIRVGLNSVFLVDLVTLCIAIGTLSIVRIPRPATSSEGRAARDSGFWQELTFGTRYIVRHGGLLGLVIIFMLIYLFASLTYFGILPAMILKRSGGDELVLSSVQAVLGAGGIVGGILMTIWGGPRRKIHGVLGFCAASFLLGDLLFAVGRTQAVWLLAAFATTFFIPFIGSSNRAIWQSKVPLDIQGRVLGASYALQQITRPIGYLLAGPLADRIFEPAMMSGGALNGTFGWLVGSGPGAGMGLMFVCTAIFGTLSCLGGYLFPALRNVEQDLPDYDAVFDGHLIPDAVIGD